MGLARLARPANLPTAAADIIAGVSIGYYFFGKELLSASLVDIQQIALLVFSSVFLYAGGVALNDVFDAKLDAVERPERAIPSGVVSVKMAGLYGVVLLIIGCVIACVVSSLTGYIAMALAAAIILYDAAAKKHGFFGPLCMGICRGLNLFLGTAILESTSFWWMACIPILYIFAITLISRGEVHGDNKNHIVLAGLLYAIVIGSLAFIMIKETDQMLIASPFLLLFAFLIFKPLIKAYQENSPAHIKAAVKAGVLSLVVMNACWAVGFGSIYVGLAVLVLLPCALLLSKLFAVT